MSYHSMPKGPWDEPWGAQCKQCGMPIFPDQPVEDIKFPDGTESDEMSGTYHAECAKPFASIARALNTLHRWSR